MPKTSAGILLYRRGRNGPEVLLVHPGGPFYRSKDAGVWTIPKGEMDHAGEEPVQVAVREFAEETGGNLHGPFRPLTPIVQKGGKRVLAWAAEGDFEPAALRSNTFTLEWPPGSGRTAEFPEVDRAAWYGFPEARERILASQRPLLDELEALLEQEGTK
jgi:predicted NUDIX family NTP pyrophosphohydrolase